MKLLITGDGSECSDAAIDDLRNAGLPEVAEALVLSVGELTSRLPELAALAAISGYYIPHDPNIEEWNERQITGVRSITQGVAEQLELDFPKWRITTVEAMGSPQSFIAQRVISWKPDLVVIGSHGRSGFKRLTLGSTSRYVLNHSKCSVRIGRCRNQRGKHGIRLLIGTDGSDNAMAAVRCVAGRHWPSETEVRVVSVLDRRPWLVTPLEVQPGLNYSPMIEERLRDLAQEAAEDAKTELAKSNLIAVARVAAGSPGDILVAEAERWDADCIFVGATGHNGLGRILLGSVSTAVGVGSHCSVEVVRSVA